MLICTFYILFLGGLPNSFVVVVVAVVNLRKPLKVFLGGLPNW